MKALIAFVFGFGAFPLIAQSAHTFDVSGFLRLIDRPPEGTPVEALSFRIHPLMGGPDVSAQPAPDGKFVLRNVQRGHYSLTFPMPGRIEVFTVGAKEALPDHFLLDSDDSSSLLIVVSMKSATVAVKIVGLPRTQSDAIALLIPFDNRLTLRESCYSNHLTGPDTIFQFVPPGKYRVLVFNSKYSRDVAAYAPRVPNFLSRESVTVVASTENDPTASVSFVTDQAVETAIREAGGPFDPFKSHNPQ